MARIVVHYGSVLLSEVEKLFVRSGIMAGMTRLRSLSSDFQVFCMCVAYKALLHIVCM